MYRQDIAIERVHERFLYTSLVCERATREGWLYSIFCSEPTVFENYVHDIHVDDQLVELSLWDTAGA